MTVLCRYCPSQVSELIGTFRIAAAWLRIISDRGSRHATISELFGSPFSHENGPYFFLRGGVFSKLDLAPSESKTKCQSARMERMRRGRSWARTAADVAATAAPDRAHKMHRSGAGPAAHRLPWPPLDPSANRPLGSVPQIQLGETPERNPAPG
jgi:hypothetical protein